MVNHEKHRASQRRYWHSPKGIAARKRYESSAKGKARRRRYNISPKGIARRKKYCDSEKGRAYYKSDVGRMVRKIRDASPEYRLRRRLNYQKNV